MRLKLSQATFDDERGDSRDVTRVYRQVMGEGMEHEDLQKVGHPPFTPSLYTPPPCHPPFSPPLYTPPCHPPFSPPLSTPTHPLLPYLIFYHILLTLSLNPSLQYRRTILPLSKPPFPYTNSTSPIFPPFNPSLPIALHPRRL